MRHFLYAAAALAAFATPVSAETIAITGGRVVIGDGSAPIEGGTVVVRDGVVVAAGAGVSVPSGARRIDASGKWVTPGVFAGFTRLGLAEVDAVNGTNDKSGGRSGFSAAIDVAPAIDPFRTPFAVNRSAGVTRAVVAPEGSTSIFAGQGAIADLGADSNPVTKARAFQFAEFGEDGADAAGGSRAGTHLHFRAMLREAQDYAAGRGTFDDDLLKAEDAKALLSVLRGETRLLIHVEGANDILRLIELKRDFPSIKMVFVGVSEGWRVAPQLAQARIPVIASALNDLPAIVSLERVPGATGLTWDEAFAAISSVPADIMGVGDRLGSLKAGKAADVVVWDGDPLELSSAPTTVIIDGVEQPLDNRQNRLRDRYARPTEGNLPKAYDR